MPDITGLDAIELTYNYYRQRFSELDAARAVSLLVKVDVAGLVKYAYEAGTQKESWKVSNEFPSPRRD